MGGEGVAVLMGVGAGLRGGVMVLALIGRLVVETG